MIDVEYCRLLARYNRWMNERLYAFGLFERWDRCPDAERHVLYTKMLAERTA